MYLILRKLWVLGWVTLEHALAKTFEPCWSITRSSWNLDGRTGSLGVERTLVRDFAINLVLNRALLHGGCIRKSDLG